MPVDWATYETEVVRLYMEEGKTALETIDHLNQRHGLDITLRQFKEKFGGLKKLTAEEWHEIERQIHERNEQGRASEIYVFGKRQDPSRLKRAFRHSKNSRVSAKITKDWSAELFGRQRVQIRTPPPQQLLPSLGETPAVNLAAQDITEVHPDLHNNVQFTQMNNLSCSDINSSFDSMSYIHDLTELGVSSDEHFSPTPDSAGSIDTDTTSNTMACIECPEFSASKSVLKSPFSPITEPAPLQVSPSVLNMTCEGDGFFCPSWGPTGAYGSFEQYFTRHAIRMTNNFPTFNWDQTPTRVPRGRPGWLNSQLLGFGSSINLDKRLIKLLENILMNKEGNHSLEFNGYHRETLLKVFYVVMHLISNKSLSRNQLFNFINWLLDENPSIPLNDFLRTKPCATGNIVAEILSAISDEADWKNYDGNAQDRNSRSHIIEDYFIRRRPVETANLIRLADHRSITSSIGGRLLVHTAQANNLDAVNLLVERGADVNYVTTDNFETCFSGHISLGQDPMTPLCGAVRGGSTTALRYLIERGANINLTIKLPEGMGTKSALLEAVQNGSFDMAETLLKFGAKASGSLMIGVSSIHKYAKRTSPAISKLLEGSYDPTLDFNSTENLLLLVEAAESGTSPLCDFLLQHDIFQPQLILEAGLCHAVKMRNILAVKTLLQQHVDPNVLLLRQAQYSDKLKRNGRESEVAPAGLSFDSESPTKDTHRFHDNSDLLQDLYGDLDADFCEDSNDQMYSHHPIFLSANGTDHGSSADILHLLLKAGSTIPEGTLSHILRRGHYLTIETFRTMIKAKFHFNLVGPSALEQYVYRGKGIAEVERLLHKGVDINSYGAYGKSALQAAAIGNETHGDYGGNPALVHFLLERGAQVNLPASGNAKPVWTRRWVGLGLTALQAAAMGGNGEIIDCLLEAGADVKAPPAKTGGYTVLEAAAFALSDGRYSRFQSSVDERVMTFKKLVTRGAPINRADGVGCTVLHSLVRGSQTQCLKIALEARANTEDRESRINSQMTPFQVAAAYHNIEAMKILLSHYAEVNAPASEGLQGFTALQAALYNVLDENDGKIERPPNLTEETITFLLRNHANVNAPPSSKYGRTALQAATSQEQPDPRIVTLLLNHGANVNAVPAKTGGVTALQGAAASGDLQIAKMLIDNGADVNALPAVVKGRTAVEAAAEHGRLDMVRMLLSAGAVPGSNGGFSRAIRFAEKAQRFDISDLLRK